MAEHDAGGAGPTPSGIMQLALGFWGSKTLLSAVEMGVFTELASGPEGYEALRDRLGLHERSARDFLDALVALHMLERDGDTYANTPRPTPSSTGASPRTSAGSSRWPTPASTASGAPSPRGCAPARRRTS